MNDFIRALDKYVGFDAARPLAGTSDDSVFRSDEISISIDFPYATYRLQLIEAIRKREPIEKLTIQNGVTVSVFVWEIGAPDIEKVIVERDGREIRPLSSTLRPTIQRTALGATVSLHEGSVRFPCSAFAPGATVTVTAIPAADANFIKVLDSATLLKLK